MGEVLKTTEYIKNVL